MEELFSLFTLQISKCSRCIRKIKQEEMSSFDLKGPHVSCLYYLYKSNSSLTLKELCDICDEDKAHISKAVDSLEKDGYIETNSKTEKKYKCPLTLTDKGRLAAEKTVEKIDQIVESAGLGVTQEDRETFYKTFKIISDNLQKICEKYGD